ncbi:MAG: ABC transporter substrate-binding protein [Chloroflexota bacterium]|nr:ABC transporter substrate-binding protein [Chloroflexota bacterium]
MKKNRIFCLVLPLALIVFACQAGKDNSVSYDNHNSVFTHSIQKHYHTDHNEKPRTVIKEELKSGDIQETYEKYLSSIDSILEPKNISWPRKVKINEKEIVISDKPKRLATISLGHDEILFGITDTSQIVATTSFSKEDGSNIKSKSEGLPTISSDPETIIAQNPDIVFADPFASVELIDALEDFGITVIQTKLNNSIDGRKNDVWLMSYITGNLSNGKSLVEKIDKNIQSLQNLNNDYKHPKKKVITLSWWDAYWTAGTGSTEDSIIQLAGGINLSAENNVESNSTIDKELLILMDPEIILITQSVEWGGKDFYDELLADESLKTIQAIKNKNVYMVNPNWWGTLSYWNIKGSEQLAKILFNIENIEGFGGF